jgi:hypothetical protein
MESVPFKSGPAPWACNNMSVRMRRENPVADTTNARGYERWRSSVPQPIEGLVGRPDVNADAPFMDTKPQQTRTDVRNWIQSPSYNAVTQVPLQNNPYFRQYDIASDPRNVGRELRGVVSEPASNRGQDQNRALLGRMVESSRYMPENEINVPMEKMLDSYSQMRPALNDMRATFR